MGPEGGNGAALLRSLMAGGLDVDAAIERLVVEHGFHRRAAEIAACQAGEMPGRYDRNRGTLGTDGQARLLQAAAMVVGLGGLGGYVLEQLARSGVGTLVAVDGDRFDATNLNRQLLADTETLGRDKVQAAKARVAKVNPAVEFVGYRAKVEELPDSAYQGVEVVIDCLDQGPARLHLETVGNRLQIPLVHGAIGGWYGQVAVIWPGSNILSALYQERDRGVESRLGNPAFTPTVAAGLMAAEAVKVLLGLASRDSRLLFFDLLQRQWELLELT